MELPPSATQNLISISLTLGQYPILAGRIRARMRRELFERGIIHPQAFDAEVRERAIQSQRREGLTNPSEEEPAEIWELRTNLVQDQLTDLYFSRQLPLVLFERIIQEVLSEKGVTVTQVALSINPELAPIEQTFDQALTIETMPPHERIKLEARLQESKVVLIRSLISDQLGYINIAKEWFTVSDLAEIRRRKIGPGRIGGKAAGMLLAGRILNQIGDDQLRERVSVPESYFLGSDVMYTYMSFNNLVHWNDQKYKPEEQMRAEYPQIQSEFQAGHFPAHILEKLSGVLEQIGRQPVIVRSSSLLEDNFGTSFAGKYDSIFCPNQGTPEENLRTLTRAIALIYSTTLNPNALLYRRSKGLQDYDERMAILVQVVQGERWGRYFLPDAAGVAFSRNVYRWSPQIRKEDGFVRLVWGLGTRAVDRVGNDYPRLVALSHPLLRPSSAPQAIRRYSQQYVDLIDLEDNQFKTLPVHDVLQSRYRPLRYLAQIEQDGYFSSLRTNRVEGSVNQLVITFEEFLRRTPFADTMRLILTTLEQCYHSPIDMEFTAHVVAENGQPPDIRISIIQCRPQSRLRDIDQVQVPVNLPPEAVIFSTRYMVPQGYVPNIRYVVYVDPKKYFQLPSMEDRNAIGRSVGQLNAALASETFLCVGPGRWGTCNTDLGIHVDYGDIYNAKALVEVAGEGTGLALEPSFGTHFFQDLLESQIYPLGMYLDDPETVFNRAFFDQTPNRLTDWVQPEYRARCCLHLIKVEDFKPGHHIELVMDDEQSQAVAFLVPDKRG